MTVVTPTPLAMSPLNPNSSAPSFGPLPLRKYPALPGFRDDGHALLPLWLLVEEPRSFERERKVRKRGRKVAMAAAVMPIPGSTVLQIATSVVE